MSIVSPPLPASHDVRQHRLISIWLDGIERGWGVPIMLALFVAAWMAILSLAYLNAGPHPDVIEAWALGRSMAWGHAKHPPLMGWVMYAWDLVFPATDWSMQLLAMVNAALGLWFVDLIARRFVSGDKRAVVLLLAMLLPAYHFHAQRFNANAVLLAVWPLAIYCFLRSFETRTLLWSIAAGVTAALAMLGKYYSVFLIASFVLAAIAHPQRLRYFRSPAPWISALAGLIALGPHLHWLWTNNFPTFSYAASLHVGFTPWEATFKAFKFILGIGAWLAVPALVWILLAKPRLARRVPDLRALDPGLVLLALVFAGTILIPVATAIVARTSLPGLWALQGLFLPVFLAVCAFDIGITRSHAIRLAVTIAIATTIGIALAPLHAIYRNDHPFKEDRSFFRGAVTELATRWSAISDTPIRIVSGDGDLALAVSFYHPDHPVARLSWRMDEQGGVVPPDWLDHRGWAAICLAQDLSCGQLADQAASFGYQPIRTSFEVRSMLFGRPGASQRMILVMAPPQRGESVPRPAPAHDDDIMEFSASKRRADNLHE